HDLDTVHIYSASWGPSDHGGNLDGPGILAQQALETGVQRGRQGRGAIYVFAAGNGGVRDDNCNFDGFANSVYTVAVGAVTKSEDMPPYGEMCSAHLVVAYGGDRENGLWTTDAGGCTDSHMGTSAAAPLVTGAIALALQARPDLGWRDVQHLLATTARRNAPNDPEWTLNGAGLAVSHKFGFGILDVDAFVTAASAHELLPPVALGVTKSRTGLGLSVHPITYDAASVNDSLTVDRADVRNGLAVLEHVRVTVHLQHDERRHLVLTLVSPSGTPSVLATPRANDNSSDGFNPWTFMSVRHWGESPLGVWTLQIMDTRFGHMYPPLPGRNYSVGILHSWDLVLSGTCDESQTVRMVEPKTAAGEQASATGRSWKSRLGGSAVMGSTRLEPGHPGTPRTDSSSSGSHSSKQGKANEASSGNERVAQERVTRYCRSQLTGAALGIEEARQSRVRALSFIGAACILAFSGFALVAVSHKSRILWQAYRAGRYHDLGERTYNVNDLVLQIEHQDSLHKKSGVRGIGRRPVFDDEEDVEVEEGVAGVARTRSRTRAHGQVRVTVSDGSDSGHPEGRDSVASSTTRSSIGSRGSRGSKTKERADGDDRWASSVVGIKRALLMPFELFGAAGTSRSSSHSGLRASVHHSGSDGHAEPSESPEPSELPEGDVFFDASEHAGHSERPSQARPSL
ncbi:hypothetical protein BC831DRAFT_266409, partial [Entophlyctis helioformis]